MSTVAERVAKHHFPRLANQIQAIGNDVEFPLFDPAYPYDYLVLDIALTRNRPGLLGPHGRLRIQNPTQVQVAYFSALGLPFNTGPLQEILNEYLAAFNYDWWLYDVNRFPVVSFEGFGLKAYTQNQTLQTVNIYLPAFLYERALRTGLWDGIFYDNSDNNISWLQFQEDPPRTTGDLSINNDGSPTNQYDADMAHVTGMRRMLEYSNELRTQGGTIVGNVGWNWLYDFADLIPPPSGTFSVDYSGLTNGFMIENAQVHAFDAGHQRYSWWARMRSYAHFNINCMEPRLCMIMANQDISDPMAWDFTTMRFWLASTLMFDGYFCFTNTGQYQQSWWFDEYTVKEDGAIWPALKYKGYLGLPDSGSPDAYNAQNSSELLVDVLLGATPSDAQTKAWRRDFDNGIVLVNPSSSSESITLTGSFKKILGNSDFEFSDPTFNDGSTISSPFSLAAESGIILLKV